MAWIRHGSQDKQARIKCTVSWMGLHMSAYLSIFFSFNFIYDTSSAFMSLISLGFISLAYPNLLGKKRLYRCCCCYFYIYVYLRVQDYIWPLVSDIVVVAAAASVFMSTCVYKAMSFIQGYIWPLVSDISGCVLWWMVISISVSVYRKSLTKIKILEL